MGLNDNDVTIDTKKDVRLIANDVTINSSKDMTTNKTGIKA